MRPTEKKGNDWEEDYTYMGPNDYRVGSPGSNKYAILDELEQCRASDGSFTLMLTFPGEHEGLQTPTTVWRQSNNPYTQLEPGVTDHDCSCEECVCPVTRFNPKYKGLDKGFYFEHGAPGRFTGIALRDYGYLAGEFLKAFRPSDFNEDDDVIELYAWCSAAQHWSDQPVPRCDEWTLVGGQCDLECAAPLTSTGPFTCEPPEEGAVDQDGNPVRLGSWSAPQCKPFTFYGDGCAFYTSPNPRRECVSSRGWPDELASGVNCTVEFPFAATVGTSIAGDVAFRTGHTTTCFWTDADRSVATTTSGSSG
jgi:hypothetical protein